VWGILFAFGLVGGIDGWATKQAEDPTMKRFLMRKRLMAIAQIPDSQQSKRGAEDALVLARRLDEQKLVVRFESLVSSLERRTR
jgi:hypothetical protein